MALGLNTEQILNDLNKGNDDELIQNQKDTNVISDILKAPFRGVEGAVQGVYNLADWATFDALPDYDNRFLGRSETIAGSLVEGITQFIVPYGAVSKGLSAAGKATKFAKPFMKVNKKGKEVLNWKGVLASEAATDFVAFDAQEERLSNLVQAFPSLQNPVTEYLAAEKDDAELEGRFKNTLEGLGITGAVAGAFGLSLKAHRKWRSNPKEAKKLVEGQDFKQLRNVEVDSYSNAMKASKSVFTQSKRLDKNKSVPVNVMEKELIKYGEKGTAEELRWMGFADWAKAKGKARVTQKEVDEFLRENQFVYKLKERTEGDTSALYSDYKQKGGDNYREFVLETNADSVRLASENVHQHFNDRTLLHFRTTDRFDDTGSSRVLFVEELQSDIIQKSRNNDFTEGKKIPLEESYIPAAMRMIMQLASKEGYDRVQWGTPQQIASLYDTRVDNIKLNAINEDGSKSFDITKDSRTTTRITKNDDEMVALFGKKAAERLNESLTKEGDETGQYSVKQDSKSFNQYKDKMVSAVNKIGKQFGSKVEIKQADKVQRPIKLSEDANPVAGARETVEDENGKVSLADEATAFFEYSWVSSSFIKDLRGDVNGKIINRIKNVIEKYDIVDDSVIFKEDVDDIRDLADVGDLLSEVPVGLKEDQMFKDINDVVDDYFKNNVIETKRIDFGEKIESFGIDLNDGMKNSVKEIRTWGLLTGDEARKANSITDPALSQVLSLPAIRYLDNKEVMAMERDFTGSIGGETNAKFALERLAENGSTPQVKAVAAGLLEMLGKDSDFLNTTVRSIIEDSDSLGSFGFKDGKQNVELYTNRTQIDQGKMSGDAVFSEATLLHELTHAAQVRYIPREISTISNLKGADYITKVDELIASSDTAPAVKSLLESYKTALDNAPDEFKGIVNNLNDATGFLESSGMRSRIGEWYGLTNVDEFLAEAMSNTKFQNYLRSVKTGNTTLWDNIVQVLKDLFGVDAKGTLLGDTLSNFADLVSKQNRKYAVENYITPYGNPIRSRGSRINENRFFQKSGAEKEGIQVSSRGGKIAVEGVGRSLADAETAYDLGELISITETRVLDEMEKTGQIGFYRDGSPEASDGLKKGGVVQAVEQARRMAEMSGQKIDIVESEVRAAGKDADALRRISARMYTVESMAMQQADEIMKKADAISKAGTEVTDSARADLLGDVQKMMNLVAAGSNLRRGFGQGLQSTQFARTKLSLSQAERRSQEIVNQYMAMNKGGKNDFDKLVNNIILMGKNTDIRTGKATDMIEQMLGIAKAARANQGGKFMEMTQNWFINSLLSGPRTMMKNGVGNFIAQAMLQTELAVGGITVNPAITRMALKEFATLESFRESFQYFLKVYSLKDQLLDIGRNPMENTAKTGIPKYFDNASPEETMKQSFNWFSEEVVNIPAKMLMSMDEVFKQALYRQNAKLEWTLKGMKLGIKDPDELADYVMRGMDAVLVDGERAFSDASVLKFARATVQKMDEDAIAGGGKAMTPQKRGAEVRRIINEETQKRADMLKSHQEGGLGIENISDIDNVAARSLEQARYGTFTNDAGAFADLAQAMVQKVKPLGLIFPFIRTPVNILKFSFDRASFGVVGGTKSLLARMPDMPMITKTQQELRTQLNSRNPIEVARARGKMATATMINSALLYMIMSNREFITGGGPKNNDERKTLEETGWQKYSLTFGNKYVGYSGLDPLGTHFGVLVDLVEQLDDHDSLNTTITEQIFAAATISLTRNVTDKSYLAGLQYLTDALSEPDRKMERAIRNLAGGFVPNILYQGQSIAGDTTTREVRSIGDAFMKKLPLGSDNLDPKRNILGEPVTMEQIKGLGPFNPSAISTRKGDVVFEELAKLEHGFTQTGTMLDRSVDLTEYVNSKGQSAFDRRLEILGNTKIRNKTLRQSLEKLISSRRYQRLSPFSDGGFKSPRVQEINKILSAYRSRSLSLMMEEFPEIEAQYLNLRKAKNLARRGGSSEDIQQLIEINPNY